MQDITSRLRAIFVNHFGVAEAEVTNETHFTEDLGADSLDAVETLMEIEREFQISIPDNELHGVNTFGELAEYLRGVLDAGQPSSEEPVDGPTAGLIVQEAPIKRSRNGAEGECKQSSPQKDGMKLFIIAIQETYKGECMTHAPIVCRSQEEAEVKLAELRIKNKCDYQSSLMKNYGEEYDSHYELCLFDRRRFEETHYVATIFTIEVPGIAPLEDAELQCVFGDAAVAYAADKGVEAAVEAIDAEEVEGDYWLDTFDTERDRNKALTFIERAESWGRVLAETPDIESLKKLSFKDIKLISSKIRKKATTSLLLSEGLEVASGKTNEFSFAITVQGSVRVAWHGQIYKDVSQFPDNLVKALETGTAKGQRGFDAIEENWYEVSFYDTTGKTLINSYLIDIDLSVLDTELLKNIIALEWRNLKK